MENLEYLKTLFEHMLDHCDDEIEYAKENGFPQYSIGFREGNREAYRFAVETINDLIENPTYNK